MIIIIIIYLFIYFIYLFLFILFIFRISQKLIHLNGTYSFLYFIQVNFKINAGYLLPFYKTILLGFQWKKSVIYRPPLEMFKNGLGGHVWTDFCNI